MRFLYHLILSMPIVGAYAMFAVGIVVIYRASRVLNLAHGAMAMIPAYVTYTLVEKVHLPVLVAGLIGVVSGALLGMAIELVFVRGLRHLSLTAQTVGTVAVLSLLIALAAKVFGTKSLSSPEIFPKGFIPVGSGRLLYGGIGLIGTAIVLAVVMLAVFKFTNLGLAMRGSAENRRAASLMGINPNRTTSIAWAIGGALAAVSGILLAAITTLNPYDLPLQTLPAFVAALLGGVDALLGALIGSVAVGLVYGSVPALSGVPILGKIAEQTGGPELALTLVALGVMYFRGARLSVASKDDGGFTSGASGKAKAIRKRVLPLPVSALFVVLSVVWVWIFNPSFAVLANISQGMIYIVVAISLVVLTGWVGQISLGHAALVGIGAFGTGILTRSFGIPFPFNLPFAAALSGAAAVLLGAVALRVRGLYLAVATLIFSWMADSFLFRSSWFVGTGGSSTIPSSSFGSKGGFPNFDLTDPKVLYFFGLAVTAIGFLALSNLRGSKTGRAFFAVRGSETAAASLGVNVMRYKLLAFGISGILAGAAGNMIMINQRTIVPDGFKFTFSLFYLSIAVVGGMTSLTGVVFASMLFAVLNYLFTTVQAFNGYIDVVSATLLVTAILLQAYRTQITKVLSVVTKPLRPVFQPIAKIASTASASLGHALDVIGQEWAKATSALPTRKRKSRSSEASDVVVQPSPNGQGRRKIIPASALAPFKAAVGSTGQAVSKAGKQVVLKVLRRTAPVVVADPDGEGSNEMVYRSEAPVVIEGRNITVQFGGLTAVSNASIAIHQGEIVGLIGPNGAGKTTLFNALSGLNQPTSGVVRMAGIDVSDAPVHERARLGLGRTFQVLQLFGDLTVRENLLVATHVHNETGFLKHIIASDAAVVAEREAHRRVKEVLALLELTEFADRPAAGLPFGILRLVELGRAVVTQAPLILLDEAASGLDNTETDRFTDFLRSLRDQLGISMLLIEHDVRMVTGVSDYMYVLNMGQLIAEGRPEQIQRDPAVIAAYLGETAPKQAPEPVGAPV